MPFARDQEWLAASLQPPLLLVDNQRYRCGLTKETNRLAACTGLLITTLVVTIRGDQVRPPSPAARPATAGVVEHNAPSFIIGVGDVLSVTFWRDPTMSGDVLVRPDGKISLPL